MFPPEPESDGGSAAESTDLLGTTDSMSRRVVCSGGACRVRSEAKRRGASELRKRSSQPVTHSRHTDILTFP